MSYHGVSRKLHRLGWGGSRDMLGVQTKVLKIKNASVRLSHEIKRGDDLIFKMSVNLVFLCQEGKIGRIPQETKEFFELFTD